MKSRDFQRTMLADGKASTLVYIVVHTGKVKTGKTPGMRVFDNEADGAAEAAAWAEEEGLQPIPVTDNARERGLVAQYVPVGHAYPRIFVREMLAWSSRSRKVVPDA